MRWPRLLHRRTSGRIEFVASMMLSLLIAIGWTWRKHPVKATYQL